MYLLADIIYLVAYRLIRYRLKVVRENLALSFPEKSKKELRSIERRYYRHLADLLIEGIHNLYASPSAIKRRYRFKNRQLVDRYYEQGRSIILASAHYNNWEYMVSSLNMQLLHHGIGVGKPLNDRMVAGFVNHRRTRFGTQVVFANNVRQEVEFYDRHHVPCALMMLGDQSPSDSVRCYWTQFLNHDTPFLYGTEYFARKYNYPVIYYRVNKVRRGRYEVEFSLLCENPQQVEQYSIVEQYARTLEADIRRQPEYWLWSHRRWKHKRPTDAHPKTDPIK